MRSVCALDVHKDSVYLCDGYDLAYKLTYPTGGHGSQFEP